MIGKLRSSAQKLNRVSKMKNLATDGLEKVRGLPEAATQRVEALMWGIRGLLYQTVIALLTSGLLLMLAAFIYGSFYFAFVPSPVHEGPVHLVFEPCQENMGKCGFLNASLILSERNPVLMTGQQYTLSLSLEMPESEVRKNNGIDIYAESFSMQVNKRLGMFMTCAQLLSKDSNVVRNACRSTMMRYRSESVRSLNLYFVWPALLTGYTDEKQWVNVELLDDFLDDPLQPAIRLDFQVKFRGTISFWKLTQPFPYFKVMSRYAEVYSAHFRIDARFSGLRYLMFNYPITAAIFGTSLNLTILLAVLILSWYRFFAQPLSDEDR